LYNVIDISYQTLFQMTKGASFARFLSAVVAPLRLFYGNYCPHGARYLSTTEPATPSATSNPLLYFTPLGIYSELRF
jgi:hypothetical protein